MIEVGNSLGGGSRLRYPLGYWNANGALFGIGIATSLWLSRNAAWKALRWLAVAAMPAIGLALYFTYSRGGVLSLVISVGCLLVLSRDRLWLAATAAIAGLAVLPALLATSARHSLANALATPATIDQGVTVLLILLGGIALALALYAGLRALERRRGAGTERALALSRDPALLKRVGIAGVLLVLVAAIFLGGRVWDQFSSPGPVFPNSPQQHFGDLSSGNRGEYYRVALDGLEEKPVLGQGAGSYEFTWDRLRDIELPVHNAHSLYLEAFDELGAVGGIVLLALVLGLLWIGFGAWRASPPGGGRELCAVALAAMAAFAVGAGIDWFWEIAGFGAVFFLAAGLLVAIRCRQLTPEQPEGAPERRNYGLAVAGLVLAWVAAIALVGPLLVQHEIKQSQHAAASGDISSAIGHANNARSIEPWASTPYVQLGLLAQLQGDYPAATERLSQAIDRSDRDWTLYYLRSKVEHEAGDETRARADLDRAQQLNPLETCLQSGWSCG